MATKLFTGNALTISQSENVSFGQQPANTTVTATINGKAVSYTSATGTNDDLVSGINDAILTARSSGAFELSELTFLVKTTPGVPTPNATYLQVTMGSGDAPFTLTFSLTTLPTVVVARTVVGKAGINEIQKLSIGPDAEVGSTFTVTFGAQTTVAVPVPAAPPLAAAVAGSGGQTNGMYYCYGVTFYNTVNGVSVNTEVAYRSNVVQYVTGDQINLTNISQGNLASIGRNIWRTIGQTTAAAALTAPLFQVGSIGNNVTTTYTDGATDAFLATQSVSPASNEIFEQALWALSSIGNENVHVSGVGLSAVVSTGNINDLAATFRTIDYLVQFDGSMGGASQALFTGTVSGVTVLPRITVTSIQTGRPIQSEVQQVGWVQSNGILPPTGSYKVVIAELGVTTAPIAFNATFNVVLAAIQAAVPSVYANSFTVTNVQSTNAGYLFAITYKNVLANLDVAQATVDVSGMVAAPNDVVSASFSTTQEGSMTGQNEKLLVTLLDSPTAGAWWLCYTDVNGNHIGGTPRGSFQYNDTTATIEAGGFVNTAKVSGAAGGPYTLEFYGGLVAQQRIYMVGMSAMTAGVSATFTATHVKVGAAAVNEQQTITINGATGGTLTLNFKGVSTGNVPYNETSGNVQTDLTGLSTVGAGNVTVTGSAGGPYTVTGAGAFAGLPLPLLGYTSALTGSTNTTVNPTSSVAATGPHWWTDPNNWSPSGVPINGDDVVLQSNNTPIKYGLDQHLVTLNSLEIDMSYLGAIGLPAWNGKYYEYRPQELAIGVTTNILIGIGKGSGPSLVRLNTGTVAAKMTIFGTGNSADPSLPVVQWTGSRASGSTEIDITKGSIGIAMAAGSAAVVDVIKQGYEKNPTSDSYVYAGPGATITTWLKDGGDSRVNCSVTTFQQKDGTTQIYDPAGSTSTFTTLTILGGTVLHRATGVITTLSVGTGGTFDRSEDQRSVTVTHTTLFGGSSFLDPHGAVVFTNPYFLSNCGYEDLTKFQLGTNITAARTQL